MGMTVILLTSMSVQVVAAILALRLIRTSGRWLAWILIACAVTLMAVRRAMTLYSIHFREATTTPDLAAELVALLVSVLMLAAIALLEPIFKLVQSSGRDLSARVRQQAAVAEIGQLALQGVALVRLMDEVVRIVAENLDVEYCKILEYQPEDHCLTLKAGVGWKPGLVGRAAVSAGVESQAGYTLVSDVPVTTHNLDEETRFCAPPLLCDHGVVSGVSVVIRGEERPYGVLGAHSTEPRVFSKDDVHFVEAIANVLAAAVEWRRKEKALKVREERYTELFENAMELIYTHDLEGRFSSINPAGETLTGYSQHEIVGMHVDELLAPEHHDQAMKFLRGSLLDSGPIVRQFEIVSKAGKRISLEASVRPILRDGQAVGVLGIGRDVSRRLELEEQLRQSQKLQAVGQLAGGIAHDFNNLLTVILGFSSQLLARDKSAPEFHRRAIEEISKAGNRAASLTRQLLAFSRRQVLDPKTLDLNEVVSDMERMLRRLIGEDVELRILLAPELPLIQADQGQLEQVIVNLAVNARDAMPEGGRLMVETGTQVEKVVAPHAGPRRSKTWVVLTVSDTGCGMDSEIRDRIFEPFFTTKDVGEGTGLGLSTVYGIVEQSNGKISVESTRGEGTSFKILLPRTPELSERPPADTAAEDDLRGSESILLVEDDSAVRKLVTSVLESAGYRVFQASNGRDAVEIFSRGKERIDLLISDVVMPEMGGGELADVLCDHSRDLRVMFVTGHAARQPLIEKLLESGATLLRKPFDRSTLLRKVREVLDADLPANSTPVAASLVS